VGNFKKASRIQGGNVRSFADLFRGRDDAYGFYGSIANAKATDRGKRVGMAATRRAAVTPELWKEHLAGKNRLGIGPVMRDGRCWWFCIDVDFYQETGLHEDIAHRIAECGLPLVQTRSKSDGAHLWCFFAEPISAANARSIAENFKRKLALPNEHVDIFPAQDKADDVGNWVNLPYFGETCRCAGEDGAQDLTIEEFLEYANTRLQHPTDLTLRAREKVKSSTSDAPPCIDFMQANGLPEGYRNNGVTQFAIYAMKAKGDNWKEAVEQFNEEHADPALSKYELKTIFKSVQSSTYGYLCDKIKSLHCNKTECKKREFGIGGGSTSGGNVNDIILERLEKIDGEEPIYRVTIKGKRFQISLDQLFLYNSFKKAALGAINEFLPMVKQPDWEIYMNDHLEQMEIQEAAADTQMRDRVIKVFQRYAENATSESLKTAVERGVPYYDGHNLVFRGDEFMQIIDRQLNRLPREKTWAYMRDWGCVLVERDGSKFWMFVPDGPLWFDPDKGAQV
jgi:hypothetical protein